MSAASLPRQLLIGWAVLLIACALPLNTVRAGEPDSLRPWEEYRTIMWIGDSASKKPEKLSLFYQRLREMGINTAMVYGDSDPQAPLQNKFPYYVENIVNQGLCLKFNSKVVDWDKFVTEWARTGRPETALLRDYCLDDPQWLNRARKQMQEVARKNREHQPLAYDIRDELSTTISANPFDYDFNPICLQGFSQWLRTQYPDLTALNQEWETTFASWEEVKPFTTDQIKNRMASGEPLPRGKPDWQRVQALKFDPGIAQKESTRWNFAPWADFRTYMDLSLARALDQLRRATREVDPRTPVGIEGTQMPSAFGGYDLWRLSQALDWVEPYDIGNAREIFGSFMPGKTIVTTIFENDTQHASRRLWHLLLEGDRGCIIWWSEDCIDWKAEDYQLTAKGRALAPALQELTSPLGQLFLRAEPENDPIYLLYSQPSIQVDWLLESTVDGSTWLRRFSSYEAEHNGMARTRDGWLKAFQDLGYSPRFLASEQLASGAWAKTGSAVLILPTAWALSEKELGAIEHFSTSAGRAIFADGCPGFFDAHGRLRKAGGNFLTGLFQIQNGKGTHVFTRLSGSSNSAKASASREGDIADYLSDRLKAAAKPDWTSWLSDQIKSMSPQIKVSSTACVRTHRYRMGTNRLLAFERNVDYHMSEDLKQAGGNERLEKPIEIEAQLPKAAHVYDLRTQKYLGYLDNIQFTLDPWHPSLYALTTEKLKTESIVSELSGKQ